MCPQHVGCIHRAHASCGTSTHFHVCSPLCVQYFLFFSPVVAPEIPRIHESLSSTTHLKMRPSFCAETDRLRTRLSHTFFVLERLAPQAAKQQEELSPDTNTQRLNTRPQEQTRFLNRLHTRTHEHKNTLTHEHSNARTRWNTRTHENTNTRSHEHTFESKAHTHTMPYNVIRARLRIDDTHAPTHTMHTHTIQTSQ